MQNRSVLVIEDSDTLRLLLEKILIQKGYRALLARGGEEALKHLKNNQQVDFIISDLEMPTGDGPSFFAYLKEKKLKIPTLVLTAHTDATLESYASYGVQALLHKPLEPHVIEAILKFLNPESM